jgi:endonuclease YncB( thermonuclease family)
MVEQGWAVAFRKYALDYVDAENDARQRDSGKASSKCRESGARSP